MQNPQSGSFELQIHNRIKEKFRLNPEWKLVDIYADRGASGTTIKKRAIQSYVK